MAKQKMSLRSLDTEINRLSCTIAEKKEKIRSLRKEISAGKLRIKRLEKIYEKLQIEEQKKQLTSLALNKNLSCEEIAAAIRSLNETIESKKSANQ